MRVAHATAHGPSIPVGVAAAALFAVAAAQPAIAQQLEPPPALRGGFLSEARFGLFAVEPFSERSADAAIQAEILFQRPFRPADLFASYFVPRPHLGGSLAFDGGISYAFAGLTWSIDVTPRVFVEASIGGAFQETRASAFTADGRARGVPAGCGPSLRESAALGYRLNESWSFVASVEHLSNAGVCDETSSMTNFGARLGYSF